MKTTANILSRLATLIAVALLSLNLASCSASDDEPAAAAGGATVTDAQITFTYTVPEELFRYAEITVCYNNNEGTDACWEPMLDPTFTVSYSLSKFPVTAPVVMVYDTTNRPGYGKNVEWDITMDIEVSMTVGGQKVTKTCFDTYTISGDLGAGIDALQKNVLDRTYAVKLAKNGNIEFVN